VLKALLTGEKNINILKNTYFFHIYIAKRPPAEFRIKDEML
jgi:hypothetical protein